MKISSSVFIHYNKELITIMTTYYEYNMQSHYDHTININVYNVPDEMGIEDVARLLNIWGKVNQSEEAWEFKNNDFGQTVYTLYGFEFHTSQGRQWSQSLISSLHQGISISTDVEGVGRIWIMEMFESISNINHWELLRQLQQLREEVESRDRAISLLVDVDQDGQASIRAPHVVLKPGSLGLLCPGQAMLAEDTEQLQADNITNNITNIIEDDDDDDEVSREIEFWKNELKFLITCSDIEWSGYMPPVGLDFDEN